MSMRGLEQFHVHGKMNPEDEGGDGSNPSDDLNADVDPYAASKVRQPDQDAAHWEQDDKDQRSQCAVDGNKPRTARTRAIIP